MYLLTLYLQAFFSHSNLGTQGEFEKSMLRFESRQDRPRSCTPLTTFSWKFRLNISSPRVLVAALILLGLTLYWLDRFTEHLSSHCRSQLVQTRFVGRSYVDFVESIATIFRGLISEIRGVQNGRKAGRHR